MDSNSPLKTTALTFKHIALGAKMTPFAGYQMPVSYSTIKEEHMAVREKAGVFDVSHMGEFIASGKGALELIQQITSNNAARLKVGQAQYSCFPNLEGGIIDDLIVYRLSDKHGYPRFMLVVNASNIQKDWDWITRFNTHGAELQNISDECGLLAVQGPAAPGIVQDLTDTDVGSIPFYHFAMGEVAGCADVIISATGYTGSGGFELYSSNENLSRLWDALFDVGGRKGLMATGLGARDTLRLEMGYCLYGNDITDETSPIEAGLGWITKTKKGKFHSRDLFVEQRKQGVSRKLSGFRVEDRRVARQGYEICTEEGINIGVVTSGTLSPMLEIPIGMGYLKTEYAVEGQEIHIQTGRKMLKAKVCKPPFVKLSTSD